MDGAKEGAVLVSFGTNVASSWLPKDFEQTVIAAFRQLPQRFLWKWDKEVANLPPNVRVSKWLPQGDMLGELLMDKFHLIILLILRDSKRKHRLSSTHVKHTGLIKNRLILINYHKKFHE